MFRVKICGVTRPADARIAVEAGADAIGLNFYPRSPRYLDPAKAAEVACAVRGRALLVGVFVNEPPGSMARIVDAVGLDAVQLSGDEPADEAALLPYRILKAVRPQPGGDLAPWGAYPCEALLLDAGAPGAYGGTGLALDWRALPAAVSALRRPDGSPFPWILAGGLTPDNVRDAAESARPHGVDVASGVESAPGIKDAGKVARFIQNAKKGLAIAGT